MGVLAMYMLLFTAVFFMIIVTLREFCLTFKDLRTDPVKFDTYAKSGFWEEKNWAVQFDFVKGEIAKCLHGEG